VDIHGIMPWIFFMWIFHGIKFIMEMYCLTR
jgi:hypothetical protein